MSQQPKMSQQFTTAFATYLKRLVNKNGIPLFAISGERPRGIAINLKGEVIITLSDSVSIYSPREKLRSFGTSGSDLGQFSTPWGVTVDGKGNIVVADFGNDRIQKFTADSKFLAVTYIELPTDLTWNATNNKIYVVSGCTEVRMFNVDLTFSSKFGEKGNGKGQFNCPSGIACDSTGNVYVTDKYNHRIQVFTPKGVFLRMFGSHGPGSGEFNCPRGIAIDCSDLVYVSEGLYLRKRPMVEEWDNHRVSVFTSKGQFVTAFGRRGTGPGEFRCPQGLVTDIKGVVYVCDEFNDCIQVF